MLFTTMSFWSRKLLFAINFSERRFQLDDIMVVVIVGGGGGTLFESKALPSFGFGLAVKMYLSTT